MGSTTRSCAAGFRGRSGYTRRSRSSSVPGRSWRVEEERHRGAAGLVGTRARHGEDGLLPRRKEVDPVASGSAAGYRPFWLAQPVKVPIEEGAGCVPG